MKRHELVCLASVAVVAIAVLAAALTLAAAHRYSLVAPPAGSGSTLVYRLDRWTGRVAAVMAYGNSGGAPAGVLIGAEIRASD